MDSHTALARRLGASEEDLEALIEGRFDVFEPGWGAAMQYADAMTRGCTVDGGIYDALARYWSPAQIVEITAVIGLFNYFNRFAIALDVPPTR